MPPKRLHIAAVEKGNAKEQQPLPPPRTSREERQACFERLWHCHPEQFNPMRNCMEKERIERTLAFIEDHVSLSGRLVVDLGCGRGNISRRLSDTGAKVHAVDIAKNALNLFKEEENRNITPIHDLVPSTLLEDDAYDLVVCTDLIAHLPKREHRLLINELARLVKKEGFVICSTSIDIYSEDALQCFAALAETELSITSWKLSYHRLFISLRNFLEAPKHFARAKRDKNFRSDGLNQRQSFSRWWFKVNSSAIPGSFWKIFQYLTNPIALFVRQNRLLMIALEKFCRFFWSDSGVSHAIFIGKRRPLVEPPPIDSRPVERKQKKTVWE